MMRGLNVFTGRKVSNSFHIPQVNDANECHENGSVSELRHVTNYNFGEQLSPTESVNCDTASDSDLTLSVLSLSTSSVSSSPSPPSSPCISCNKFHALKSCARKISSLSNNNNSITRKNPLTTNSYPISYVDRPIIKFEDRSKRKKVTDVSLSLLCLLVTLGLVVFILILLPKTSFNNYFKETPVKNVGLNSSRTNKHGHRNHNKSLHRNKMDSNHTFMAKESAIMTARMDGLQKPKMNERTRKKESIEREDEPIISYDVIKKLNLLPTIETKTGLVQGTSEMILGKVVSTFLGIPYAKPPINDLRFRKPVPIDPWNEVYEAKEQPSPCVQFIPSSIKTPWISTKEHSEDCLYMNIWTPETPVHRIKRSEDGIFGTRTEGAFGFDDPIFEESNIEESINREPVASESNSFKTVMVWFYGGAFFSGSIDLELYDGSYLAAAGDVVVVSVNYRLGALGFLSSPLLPKESADNQTNSQQDAPGNMGMYDQVLALQWIRDNIDSFGGDPENIVLFGQSAGATSAGLHTFSPLTRDIPSRVILQSGSPLFPKIYFENSLEKSALFAQKAGCIEDYQLKNSTIGTTVSVEEYYNLNSIKVVQCLKNLSIDQLQAAHIPLFQMYKIPFFPKPGDDFLPELPHDAIDDPDSLGPQTEILIGNMRDEGSFFLHLFFPDVFKSDDFKATESSVRDPKSQKLQEKQFFPNITLDQAKYYISQAYSFIPENQAQLMSEFFLLSLSNETSRSSLLKATYDIIGDSGFICPAVILSEHLAGYNVSVYHYLMTERPTNSDWHPWMGSTHLDEVQLIFGLPIKYPKNYTQGEIDFSWNLINTWTTFAKTGKVPMQPGNVEWPQFSVESPVYLEMNSTASLLKHGPNTLSCNLWKIIYESFL